jgi:hypothetical protein
MNFKTIPFSESLKLRKKKELARPVENMSVKIVKLFYRYKV